MKMLSALALALVVTPSFAQQRPPDYPNGTPWPPPLCSVMKFEGCIPDESLKSKLPSQSLPAEPKTKPLQTDLRTVLDNAKTPAVSPPAASPASRLTFPTPQQIQEQNAREQADLESQQQRRDLEEQIDRQRREQVQQQNYAAGYAMGRGIGSLADALLRRRQINSFCKKNPTKGLRFGDGSTMTCASWNKGNPLRVSVEDQERERNAASSLRHDGAAAALAR